MADLQCRNSRRTVKRLFQDLWSNDDVEMYGLSREVLAGKHAWLEEGLVEMPPTTVETPESAPTPETVVS